MKSYEYTSKNVHIIAVIQRLGRTWPAQGAGPRPHRFE